MAGIAVWLMSPLYDLLPGEGCMAPSRAQQGVQAMERERWNVGRFALETS
ncbi:MAG TPA: hypothetical protein VHI13_01870 [Candidatus Kapabacteria bacterium]|nr:hypothetical protein [Candidatus Kapabacteria bacterium]